MTWINVKDALPGERESPENDCWPEGTSINVFIWAGKRLGMRVGRYFHKSGRWQIDGCTGDWRVTHWHPLPTPPEDRT